MSSASLFGPSGSGNYMNTKQQTYYINTVKDHA